MAPQKRAVTAGVVILAVIVLALIPQFINRQSSEHLTAGFDSEFLVRPDGYPGLKEAYNFEFASEPRHMDPGLMYRAVDDGAVDVICGFATDGRIPAYNLAVLEDDKNFFPPYHAAPLVRSETLAEFPEIRSALNALAGLLPDSVMQRLNYQVDEKNRAASEVAREFLVSADLLGDKEVSPENPKGTVRIGGKNFTEQEILGEIMAMRIESTTDIEVSRKLNLGGTMICFNALEAGDLDLYAEYTGTGLVSILKEPVISDPDSAYAVVDSAFRNKYDLIWLEPFGFNNTYTLTMRKEQAEKLGIETVSDLAEYVKENNEEN